MNDNANWPRTVRRLGWNTKRRPDKHINTSDFSGKCHLPTVLSPKPLHTHKLSFSPQKRRGLGSAGQRLRHAGVPTTHLPDLCEWRNKAANDSKLRFCFTSVVHQWLHGYLMHKYQQMLTYKMQTANVIAHWTGIPSGLYTCVKSSKTEYKESGNSMTGHWFVRKHESAFSIEMVRLL